jgi:hypothetical protein
MGVITRKEAKEGVQIFGLGWLAVTACVVAVMAIGGIVWFITVGTAGVRGDGNVHKDQQDAKNREYWSAKFNGLYNQVTADKANIDTLRETAQGKDADKQDQINYTGAKQACQIDVAEYNGNTGDVLGKLWIPDGLPVMITAATYCE